MKAGLAFVGRTSVAVLVPLTQELLALAGCQSGLPVRLVVYSAVIGFVLPTADRSVNVAPEAGTNWTMDGGAEVAGTQLSDEMISEKERRVPKSPAPMSDTRRVQVPSAG